MATSKRIIDKVPPPEKPQKIEVLVLGLSRTGTMSMRDALTKLGYKPYHMSIACINAAKGHIHMWDEAIRAKYFPDESTCAPYSPADIAKLLQEYTATTDIPSILFAEELMAAFPGAKLVLTTRSVDGWLRSVHNSIFRITSWRAWGPLMSVDTAFAGPYMALIRRILSVWTKRPWPAAGDFDAVRPRLLELFDEHAEHVRFLARQHGRELLEFQAADGWVPLCKHLGKQVPDEPYPRINDGEHVVMLHKGIVVNRFISTVKPVAIKVVAGLLAVGTLGWWMMS